MNTRTEKQKRAFVNNVVLNPDVHEFLRKKAFDERTSMKALVDEACRNHYGLESAAPDAGATASAAVN